MTKEDILKIIKKAWKNNFNIHVQVLDTDSYLEEIDKELDKLFDNNDLSKV